ncbi:MAG: caspase family protein [Elusimicrobia bacterium]|nr:caspase family protein [Elusimicrobiota bacterium]
MSHAPRDRKAPAIRRLIPAAAAALALLISGCATPSPFLRVGPPQAADADSPYAGENVYLRSFVVRTKGKDPRAEAAIRADFIDYLTKLGKFQKVVDATQGGLDIPSDALSINVDLRPSLSANDNAFAQYFSIYVATLLFPRKGSVTVNGNSTVLRGQTVIGNMSWTCTENYGLLFLGWARTGPIAEAYRSCYAETFAHIAVPTRAEAGAGISAAALQSMVEKSVQKATAKEEKAYDSDVDKPGYQTPEDKDNFALVIGIEKYQQLPQADFAERDAQTIKDHLVALGYPRRNIVHLSGSLATRSNMEKYLESWLPARVGADSKLLVYFSGHGSPGIDSGQAYLVPWDGDVNFLAKTGYPLKRLYENLNALAARRVVVLLDSCFSGAGGRSILPKGTRPLVSKVDVGGGTLGKVVVLSASDSSEITGADEAQGHGLFTYHLLKGLNEKRGQATLKALYDYLLPRVQDAARHQNRDQTPQLLSSGSDGEELSLRD